MKDYFKQSITESTYFQFDDKSVLRMRTQLNDLILILANLFQKLNKPSDQSESFRKKTLKIKVEPRDNLEDNDTSKKMTKEESASTLQTASKRKHSEAGIDIFYLSFSFDKLDMMEDD